MRSHSHTAIIAVLCIAACGCLCKASCVATVMVATVSDRTCAEVTAAQADKATMMITACLLRRLNKPQTCLSVASHNCIKSLSPEVYSCYRAVRSKWHILCDATQQASILSRLRAALKNSANVQQRLGKLVKHVENVAVESVENGLRIGHLVDDIHGQVDDVVGQVKNARDFLDAEVTRMKSGLEHGVDSVNRRINEICQAVREVRERRIRAGGVLIGAYACLGGVIFGTWRRWTSVVGTLLFVAAIVLGELFGLWLWVMRLALLGYCGFLVLSVPFRPEDHISDHNDDDLGDDDNESDGCDCCFDDDLHAH